MVKVVLPNVSHAFARVWEYPDSSTVRCGADFEAAKYLASALNFDLRWDILGTFSPQTFIQLILSEY